MPVQQKLQDRLVMSKTSMQTQSERLREQLSKCFLQTDFAAALLTSEI